MMREASPSQSCAYGSSLHVCLDHLEARRRLDYSTPAFSVIRVPARACRHASTAKPLFSEAIYACTSELLLVGNLEEKW